ncbi:uncharacterized protein EMH_0022790 [Eimeria mitis]|uniref:F-box domain-containing protein n=1 Tax=Eimeria mitis TaxID=44415 RepID=U6JVS3_9EIME|nr:uncharacterized protein EMH_0022790 [Eimeria mitis]CDJ29509.1 hypothetical protein, conserved [Eimeria mitis]
MSDSSGTSGSRSSNSADESSDACSARDNVISPRSSISSYSEDEISSCNRLSPLSSIPDVLVASILRFLPQHERIKVGSLVCRRWLHLIRSCLCQSDTTIRISPPVFRHLPPEALRACIRAIAIYSRHAKLVIGYVVPMAVENGDYPEFLFLRSLFRELSDVQSISIALGCPLTARMLGDAFAGVVQRSAHTLTSLEIWEPELAEATLAALAAMPSPWKTCNEQATDFGNAYVATAQALETSVGSHVLRRDPRLVAQGLQRSPKQCGMLLATAQVLRERLTRCPSRTSFSMSEAAADTGRLLQQLQQGQGQQQLDSHMMTPECYPHQTSDSLKNRERTVSPCSLDSGRDRFRGTHKGELRRRIADIKNCCCCVTAAETALRIWRRFESVRVVLPRLRVLASGSWRLLQAVHCPNLEELNLTTNATTPQRDASSRLQQQRQRQQHPQHQLHRQQQQQHGQHDSSHLTMALHEWADRISASGGPRNASVSSGFSESALQELLHFLLRSGYNLRQLHGSYTVGPLNESLLHSVSTAGNALAGAGNPASGSPDISARVRYLASAAAPPGRVKGGQKLACGGFFSAALAAADAVLNMQAPTLSGACDLPFPVATLASSVGRTVTGGANGLAGESISSHAASLNYAALASEAADSLFAAAAGLCAATGDGCRHIHHCPHQCCAVPCAWGSSEELLLVLLPKLRVARSADFLLLSCFLLPRLEELRLPETWGSVLSKPIPGFPLLWAYLCTYGRSLRALDVKGTAPPLAAFLGAGTTAQPLPFHILPFEAVATEALQRLLLVHRAHPLMDPANTLATNTPASTSPEDALSTAAAAANVSAGIAELAARTVAEIWHRRTASTQQQRWQIAWQDVNCEGGQGGGCTEELVDVGVHPATNERLPCVPHRGVNSWGTADGAFDAMRRDASSSRPLFGLRFGQLKHLQCHSSFLPYLAEPLPQCGSLQGLNTEGESDSVTWFVALLTGIERLCVRDACLNPSRRWPRAPPPISLEVEEEEIPSFKSHPEVTLHIRKYTGTAFFFTPSISCPNLQELQVQRGDEDFDSFLVGGGACNLRVLRYEGRLFGGTGAATPRALVASHELRVIRNTGNSDEDAQRVLEALRLPPSFSPLTGSPFASLRELHVCTLDARVVVRLALAAAAAVNPFLSCAWRRVLDNRKAERLRQLQRKQQLWMQRTQAQRDNEALRLLVRQRRLYEEYSARRRRLRRLSSAIVIRQDRFAGTREGPQRSPQRMHEETQRRLTREVASMRQQLQQLQRRLESLAASNIRNPASTSAPQENHQLQRYHRFRESLERLRRLQSHQQRLVALRRLLQISVTDAASYPVDPIPGVGEHRRANEFEAARRKLRAQRGRESDFGCSRSWCFWGCHRAVAALSQLLPQLRTCVVQRLRGNAASLRLLLRGLPRLEVFAVAEEQTSRRRHRLLQLATTLGFTVRRGPLIIPALHNDLVTVSTISRQFWISSRGPAGRRASAASVAAADLLVHGLLGRLASGYQGQSVPGSQAHTGDTPVSSTRCAIPTAVPCGIRETEAAGCLTAEVPVVARSVALGTAKEPLASSSCCEHQGIPNFEKYKTPATDEVPKQAETAVPAARMAGSARTNQASARRRSLRSLRCSIYTRKRPQVSDSRATSASTPKRRRRRRGDGGDMVVDVRQDMQMARGLAEELEEQLTS